MREQSATVKKIINLANASNLDELNERYNQVQSPLTATHDPLLALMLFELMVAIENMETAERGMEQHLKQAAKAVEREQTARTNGQPYVDTVWIVDAAEKATRHAGDWEQAKKQASMLAKMIKLFDERKES